MITEILSVEDAENSIQHFDNETVNFGSYTQSLSDSVAGRHLKLVFSSHAKFVIAHQPEQKFNPFLYQAVDGGRNFKENYARRMALQEFSEVAHN